MTTNERFLAWWQDYERTGKLGAIRLGMTRDDLHQLFGEPDDTAKGFRERPLSGIWKYGEIEFHFDFEGKIFLVYTETPEDEPRTIAKQGHALPNEDLLA